MISVEEFKKRLAAGAKEWPDNFSYAAYEVLEKLQPENPGIEYLQVSIDFMEENPDLDFGTPGPLVFFIETFPGEKYLPMVMASLKRRPMSYTVWLLTRTLNTWEFKRDGFREYVQLLEKIEVDSSVATGARAYANSWLDFYRRHRKGNGPLLKKRN